MIRLPLLLAALLAATAPPPTGEGYLVQVEQGTGRKWHGALSRFTPLAENSWECLWREIHPEGQHDWKRKATLTLGPGNRIVVEELEPSAVWRGTYRRDGRRIEAEGIGRKGNYRRHYCTFNLRATLPDPEFIAATAETGLAKTGEAALGKTASVELKK